MIQGSSWRELHVHVAVNDVAIALLQPEVVDSSLSPDF